jgi:S-adenosylmethionine hydrolase
VSIITLTTDLGTKDNYLALVKAYILKNSGISQIIDISNEIDKYNIQQAAYIFGNAFDQFPEGSIHILAVKSANSDNRNSLLISLNGHYLLCPDNGIFSLFSEGTNADVFVLKNELFPPTPFYVRDTLAKAALAFAKDKNAEAIADKTEQYVQALSFQPTFSGNSIVGKCVYIDSYGNVVTNIKKDFFEASRRNRRFTIHLPNIRIEEITGNYDDVAATDALALFNSAGHLEIAINRGAARQLLFPRNIHTHTDFNITIEFDE